MRLCARTVVTLAVAGILAAILFNGCDWKHPQSSTSFGGGGQNASLTINVSDPATCAAPAGAFSHIFLTITDVQASPNATAPAGDPSFVDLTPNLKTAPAQVDLLGAGNTQCFLAQLASNSAVAAANYKQIRVILLSNAGNTPIANNQCGTVFNCVVLANNGTARAIQLTDEATTGIVIPSGQIVNGGLNLTAGGTPTLDIDFNGCESVVQEVNGQFRLIPTLHAGTVSQSTSAITGTVVDSVSRAAILNATVIVTLEDRDANGVDRVAQQTLATNTGTFTLCPVADGTHDVVINGVSSTGTEFATTITIALSPGTHMGNVPLVATQNAVAFIQGQVNAAGAAGPASVDVVVSALQSANGTLFTVPLALQGFTSFPVSTVPSPQCANGSNCATYIIDLPEANPNVGTFSSAGTTYTQAAGAVGYTVDARAFVIGGGNTPDCTPTDAQQALANVALGQNNAAAINFSGCQ